MSRRLVRPGFFQRHRTSGSLSSLRKKPSSCSARTFFTSSTRQEEDYSHLQKDLPQRKIPLTYDYLVPTPSHLLTTALSDFLPSGHSSEKSSSASNRPTLNDPIPLPKAHHLIYFPPAIPGADLLPDGTDPLQSPGPPFVRRMWAGGSVRWNNSSDQPLKLNGSPAAVLESIRDVAIKGKPGDEKIFVGIERRVGILTSDDEDGDTTRRRFWREAEDDFADGAVGVIERRNIVFMRERPREQASDAGKSQGQEKNKAPKQMAPPHEDSDFNVTLTPDPKLLFRYSALTYNAHAIHLDPEYCRNVEGHRGMLVHGPLSFTLLVTMLGRQLVLEKGRQRASFIEYRNLSPLYCNETLHLKGRRIKEAKNGEEGKWDVWVENSDGGVAVKGMVRTQVS